MASSTPINGANRFLLWVDSVGGYLVCLSDTVVLGQPAVNSSETSHVDVPILGDLSRRHALIHRDGEGYLIEPVRAVYLRDQRIEHTTTLRDGDVVQLGDSVRLRFRRPHPLSQTARLEPVSYHRTQPATSAVLLMADSCILGPASSSHVVCPRWTRDVVIHRQPNRQDSGVAQDQPNGLACRTRGEFTIDGIDYKNRGALSMQSRVAAADFSFNLEAL